MLRDEASHCGELLFEHALYAYHKQIPSRDLPHFFCGIFVGSGICFMIFATAGRSNMFEFQRWNAGKLAAMSGIVSPRQRGIIRFQVKNARSALRETLSWCDRLLVQHDLHGEFIAHDKLLSFQVAVQNTDNAKNFLAVALNGRWQLLRMPHCKPSRLTEIRALAAHLEVQPLAHLILQGTGSVCETLLLVVCVLCLLALACSSNFNHAYHEILDDGRGLPERDVCVGVFDCWDTAVRVNFRELWLLELRCWHSLVLVR